jgi:hypothetical protein
MTVSSLEDIQAIVRTGARHRSVASTKSNQASSRSHRYSFETRNSDTNDVYETKSFRCQSSGTRLFCRWQPVMHRK